MLLKRTYALRARHPSDAGSILMSNSPFTGDTLLVCSCAAAFTGNVTVTALPATWSRTADSIAKRANCVGCIPKPSRLLRHAMPTSCVVAAFSPLLVVYFEHLVAPFRPLHRFRQPSSGERYLSTIGP